MKLIRILAVTAVAATSYFLVGCAGPAGYSYQNVTITLTPSCEECQQGVFYNPAYPMPVVQTPIAQSGSVGAPSPPGSVLYMPNGSFGQTGWFTATVTNAPPNITWAVYPTPDLSDTQTLPTGTSAPGGVAGNNFYNYGTIEAASGTVAYFFNGGIPNYSGAALQQAIAMGIPQGMVLLTASVPADPSNPSDVVTASQLIQIYDPSKAQAPTLIPRTPTNPSGLTTSVATVPRGTSFQFTGYEVGNAPCSSTSACNAIYQGAPLNTTDNGVIWLVGNGNSSFGGIANATVGGLVNGVPGPYGTITQTGLYTAPSVIPVSGFSVEVFLESHATPASNPANAYITIE